MLHVAGTTPDVTNATYNIKVTPGRTYPITGYCHGYKSGGRYFYTYSIKFNDLQISSITEKDASMLISWSPTINTWGTDHDFS